MTDHQSLSERFAAIRYIGDMIPTGGRGAPVAPPTYIGEERGVPKFAYSAEHPVPDPASGYARFLTDENGAHVLRPAVVINSLGAEATGIEAAIFAGQEELGVTLPGIFLNADDYSDADLEGIAKKSLKKDNSQYTPETLAQALRFDLESAHASTWTTPHRHVDTYIRHAVIDGQQIWANPGSEVYSIIAQASQGRADLLFRYFPNSALMGFWLSSVAPRRHKLARALSSTVQGYDAHEVVYGATKGDVLGGITSTTGMRRNAKTLELEPAAASKKTAPSAVGLGLVPTSPVTKAFSCSAILRRSSISLTHLRHLSVPGNPEASTQIADVLAWMGVYGLLATASEGFYRSGCDLVTGSENSSLTLIGRDGTETPWDVSVEDAAEGFRAAYAKLPEELRFAEPIKAGYPETIVAARADTLVAESNTAEEE
ncbi:hypothetical protein CFRA_09475 [Corynebacterium frankenforstense DSM 45800]|uniref:CRISPR-associated protein n=1 Tax=Corynebacterium frankenforstense DSM 45800 TaxID=1437875 RepID=A0A1L7CUG2_9CORY|nr:type I-U CRISPR-associated protein Cas7 [Corynebacterium frankenforstense]APT89438.1 hypothetical protein CFRA_09475 [Corynebacterium frankenforstense DSM 45800]